MKSEQTKNWQAMFYLISGPERILVLFPVGVMQWAASALLALHGHHWAALSLFISGALTLEACDEDYEL